ncbi:MAG: hypothetical protein ACLP5H_13975 [Desulfomonilaceae bacterium]
MRKALTMSLAIIIEASLFVLPTLSQRGEGEMGILMDWIVVTLAAMLWLYVILELLIRSMLGVG